VLLERGAQVPTDFLEEPQLPDGCEWLMQAFWDLSTERQVGMTLGPIPMSRVDALADRSGLDRDNADTLRRAVRAMDREFLKWAAAKAKKEES
jgi:hypothetical protein